MTKLKNIYLLLLLGIGFISCENTIKADYNTIRTKKLILVDDDKNEYLLVIKKDSLGKAVLDIQLESGQ